MTTSVSDKASWISLAQPLYSGMPVAGPYPVVDFSASEYPVKDGYTKRESHMEMAVHVGTHIDAANHFVPTGRSIDQYPLSKFVGPGVALDVRREGRTALDRDELESIGASVEPGDIVLLIFGHGRHFGTETYRDHPYITPAAAEWLVERGVKLVGFDLMTPEMPVGMRSADFDYPVHQVLLGADVLVIENLAGGLESICGGRLEISAVPLPIRGSDGGPCVPIARPLTERPSAHRQAGFAP